MREAYPRLIKLAPGKPVIIAEFGCDLHNRRVDVVRWTQSALEDLFSNRWPAIAGFLLVERRLAERRPQKTRY